MNTWDEQIKALKQKAEQSKQQETKYTKAGRCSCGCGRFKHKVTSGTFLRICYECGDEKEM